MVGTQNGTRLSDMELRHGVERIMERHQWTTNRVAADLRCSEQKLVEWLENPHATAFTTFRAGLVEFVKTWDRPETVPTERTGNPFRPNAEHIGHVPLKGPEPELVYPLDDKPAPWQLPAGFVPIAPAAIAAPQRVGISIGKGHGRATLSKAFALALGNPERVLVARNGTRLLVSIARDGYPSMRLGKEGDVSKSVAAAVKAEGAAPGFYPATPAGDGVWMIDLG